MSGEALLRGEDFRRDVRRYLRNTNQAFEQHIPAGTPNPRDYKIVFAILGAERLRPADGLPFFSKLNLARTFEALDVMGYRVAVRRVPLQP